MARLVLTTVGSWGDVLPLMPIATRLGERGHEVTLVADEVFGDLVRREKVPFAGFRAMLGDRESIAERVFEPGRPTADRYSALIEGLVLPQLPAAYDALTEACSDADLLLTHPYQLAGPMAAATAGVPWLTLGLFPGAIASRHRRPPGDLRPPGSEEENGDSWQAFRRLLRRFDEPLNALRAERGLPPVEDGFLESGLSRELTLVLASEAYAPRPPDWPETIRLTGFTTWDRPSGWRPAPALDAFLGGGAPPIAFTLGTTVRAEPGGFYEVAVAALDDLGRRGVFLLGRIDEPEGWAEVLASPRRAVVPYAPLTGLLPRCAAVVHHGGFSTTAAALGAGCPAVITPRGIDQPFHAGRVEALGAGLSLPWDSLDSKALAATLAEVTENPSFAAAAGGMAKRLAAEDGPGRACDEIEQALARTAAGRVR